jgi:hypothetical protein
MSICVVAGAVGSCGGGGHHRAGAGATVPPRPTATSVDVATVPATIDTAYVQKVMDALDQVLGDAIRDFAQNKGPTKRFNEVLTALYEGPEYDTVISLYGRLATQFAVGNTPPVRGSPGNPATRIESIVDSSPKCIVTDVNRSFETVFSAPAPAGSTSGVVQLTRLKPDRDPFHRNPTPWAITAEGVRSQTSVPARPCH